jgi:hypothetical protein
MVIQDEKYSFFKDLEDGVGEEEGEFARQTPAHHEHGDQDLQGVRRQPEVVPQE